MKILDRMVRRFVQKGSLTIIDANERMHRYGDETKLVAHPLSVVIRLHDRRLHYQLFLNPELYLGEAYMDGTLTIEQGCLRDFLQLVMVNIDNRESHFSKKILDAFHGLFNFYRQWNTVVKSKKNVAHHYDLSNAFYQQFLDADLNYSCAYYRDENDSLEIAQQNKLRHIAAKLDLRPGQTVLDIGSGWGSLAFFLASIADVRVHGITLSEQQYQFAVDKARRLGLENKVVFELKDYREVTGAFDRIVSVGMFEHVGASHYPAFFRHVASLLKEDGVAVLHAIGKMGKPGTTQSWIRKYIFPGGYAPALSEVFRAIEACGIWVADVEILRNHYGYTLRDWERRFQKNREQIRQQFDERFCRMWEFYLTSCESLFLYSRQMVFQIQLVRDQRALPDCRDYISENELAMRFVARPVPPE